MLYLRKNKLQVPRHRSHVKFWNTNLTYCDIYVTYIAYQQLQIISIFSTTSENNKHHLISDDVVSRHQLIWGNGNATLTVFTYPSIFLWHGLGLLPFHLKSQPVLSGVLQLPITGLVLSLHLLLHLKYWMLTNMEFPQTSKTVKCSWPVLRTADTHARVSDGEDLSPVGNSGSTYPCANSLNSRKSNLPL